MCTFSPALADASQDAPPVTAPDELTVLPGGSAYVDVMANDTDDLDQQALCRARGTGDVQASVDRGKVFVNVSTAEPGDYQVHYQACDFDYLSQGTVNVHAVAPQTPTVHKVHDQAGVLRVTNPNPVRILVLWARPHSEHLSGHVFVRAGAQKDFTVDDPHIVWLAVDPSSTWEDGSFLGFGHVRHISVPPPTGAETARSGASRWAALWRHGSADRIRATAGRRVPAASAWPRDPTTVLPPTPRTDTIHWWSGSWDRVNVTRNDTDPQGEDVDVCRLSPEATVPSIASRLTPSVIDGRLDVGTNRHASGTFLLPYYVCNSGRLAPSVLRVELEQASPLRVTRLARDPHLVRVHNPNPTRVSYVIGRSHVDFVNRRLAAHATITVRVPLSAHRWEAMIGSHGGYAGSGRLP